MFVIHPRGSRLVSAQFLVEDALSIMTSRCQVTAMQRLDSLMRLDTIVKHYQS